MAMLSFLGNRITRTGGAKPSSFVRFAVILVVVAMYHEIVVSTIVRGPSDTTTLVNKSTYFNCSTSMRPVDERSIIWYHFPLDGGGQRNYVYDDGRIMTNYRNRFAIEIDLSSGTFNLLALSLEPKDAGRYECKDDIQEGIGASAELTVLESDLICESVIDPRGVVGPTQCDRAITPDEVQLSCKVTYNGNNPPQMVWRKAGDSSTSTKTDCVTKYNSVTCNTTLTAHLQLNRSVYYCELTTQRYNCSLKISKNFYVFSGNATVNKTVDEEVKCSVNSNQSCSYKWKWFNGSDSLTVSHNQTLKPTRVGSHRCEATCPIGNKSCTVNVMVVEVTSTESPEGTSSGRMLWLLLPLLLVIVFIISMTVVLFYWRSKRANERLSTSQEFKAIESDKSAAPLIGLTAENTDQVKQDNDEPDKDTEEEAEDIQTDQSATPLASNAKDYKYMKKSHAEPDKVTKAKVNAPNIYKSTTSLVASISVEEKTNRFSEPRKIVKERLCFFDGKPEYLTVFRRERNKEKRITGVTILKNKLFIATENIPALDVYDVLNKFKSTSKRRFPIPHLVNPFDLACCHIAECVFICDFKLEAMPKEIIRIKSSLTVDKKWSTGDDFGNLSVSSESNIILCVSYKNLLIEYTKDGEKIRVITLPDLVHPCHAIKLNSGKFLVSHGRKNEILHRVCNVNEDGEVVKSLGGERGTSLQCLNEPNYLIVDEEKKIVLVADSSNKRVLLLDCDLKPKREFLSEYNGLQNPSKMCLCKATRNLFVVDSENQAIVFNVK